MVKQYREVVTIRREIDVSKLIDLTGRRVGKLTVLKRAGSDKRKHAVWNCVCDCGRIKKLSSFDLRSGNVVSCGCYHDEAARARMLKHGKSNTKLYDVWKSMKQRCNNDKSKDFRIYGEKGVAVCKEWADDFDAFYNWSLSNGYKEGLTIDRIDSNKNYEPSNCRWVDAKTQANNTSRNHFISYNGETHTMSEWSEIKGIKYSTLRSRINDYNWSIEKALSVKAGGKDD